MDPVKSSSLESRSDGNSIEARGRRWVERRKKSYEDSKLYLPLYMAALKGDWKTAEEILKRDSSAVTAKITWNSYTVLHVAAAGINSTRTLRFIQKLLCFMPQESLALTDDSGNTALSLAATAGNTDAARLLVQRNRSLLLMQNNFGSTPLHDAARHGREETVRYLLSVTRHQEPSPFTGEIGVRLLNLLIYADFYDIALDLFKLYPKLALDKDQDQKTAFIALTYKPLAFASGSPLGFWHRILYHCIPMEMDNDPHNPMEIGDVENPTYKSWTSRSINHRYLQQISTAFGTLCRKVHAVLFSIFKIVPCVKHAGRAKLMHKQSLELVRHMCNEVTFAGADALELLKNPLHIAARLGIPEIVVEIIKTCPHIIWFQDYERHDLFSLAVLYRHEMIFNLLYQISSHKQLVSRYKDYKGNNLLHLAGKLQPSSRVSGPALQMQREVQWFKEVEKIVDPSLKEAGNEDNKTPRMVFTEEHKELVKQGEEWVKATAQSSTVVAALIVTVAFAAAFTVPGGNNNEGIPIFLNEVSFLVFTMLDALALFSSSTAMLVFLGILTSSYSEEDFLKSLPAKLIIGLIALSISIASMMIAFSATLYLVLDHRFSWIMIPIASLACIPVALFAMFQFPILVEMILSTYGPGIFHQQSEDIFL